MTIEEMKSLVKTNLSLSDTGQDLNITDAIQHVINYCNITDIPRALEPYIRNKIKTVMTYEVEIGTGSVFDVKTLKEGDTSVTYNVYSDLSKSTIYGLSEQDKRTLQQFRKLR